MDWCNKSKPNLINHLLLQVRLLAQ